MIETIMAENGSPILREDGRLLASAFDPQGEARDWVQRRRAFLDRVKVVFVLGAGAGYHLAELLRLSAAQLVVIEPSQSIIDFCREIHRFDDHRVHFEASAQAADLRLSSHVKYAISQSFLVLRHSPSTLAQESFFDEAQTLLVGRDWSSLNWQWKTKGFNALNSEIKRSSPDELLTIHDLENCELVQNSAERERILIKALRELVK